MKRFDGRKLPPMKTLQGFEAVARKLSFRQAAEELHLSHQAVSQQIAQLEESLGQELFSRSNRQIALTPVGSRFYEHVSDMLSELTEQCEQIRREQGRPTLKVHTYVTVALRWLVPKLSDFRNRHPDIDVQLLSTIHQEEFDERNADIGLVFYPRELSSHLQWTHLLTPSLYPVCHPELLGGNKNLSSTRLAELPLINITSERLQWQNWFENQGISYDQTDWVVVDSTAVAIEMALAGEGIALIYDPVVERELKAGRLVRPVLDEIKAIDPWGLVYRQDKVNWFPVRYFIDWMTEQMGE